MSEWRVKPLGTVVSQITDKVSFGKDPTRPYVGLEHIPSDGASLLGAGKADDSISTNNVFRGGDVLFGKLRPRLRKCVRVNFDGYCSTDVLVLRACEDVDAVFASMLLSSAAVFTEAIRTEEGTKMPRCSWRSLRNLELPCPDANEQRRIATILTTLDEVIKATEKLVEKHQQIKAGLMHDLFTRGLWTRTELARGDHKGTPAEASAQEGQLRPAPGEAPGLYQESPLGLIPKAWKVKNCSQICEKITVGIVIRPTQYYVPESGVPAFRSANIKETGIDLNDLVFISDFSNSLLAKSQVKAGDVLSVRTGYPGTSAVVPEELEGCNCIDILISRPTSEIASQFLCDWINSSFGRGQVLRKQGGLAQQHFNVGDLRNLQVVIPSDTEQAEIGLRLASATENIATENTHLTKLRQQKQGLMHDLLTGRVRVDTAFAQNP
ncbi:MAG: restriction endonuclease subunit S [Verrucomicrobiales bacterium]